MREEFSSARINYIRSLYAQEDCLLTSLHQALQKINKSGIHIGAEEGRILQLLIRMNAVKNIVEIGTLGGYSTIWMARALPVDGRIYTIEKSTKHAEIASSFFEQSEIGYKIELMVGDAHALFSSLPQVDMVFIDADKESYPAYLDWAEANIKPGGLIVADNTFLFDTVFEEQPLEKIRPAMWEAMREFNQRLADTTKFESTMIPTNEGLSIAIKC